jgi:hypothetical protein
MINRIEFLKQKERDIRSALAAEQMKLTKRNMRETRRLESIIGAVILKSTAVSPGLATMLRQTLESGCTSDSERHFLKAKGWL